MPLTFLPHLTALIFAIPATALLKDLSHFPTLLTFLAYLPENSVEQIVGKSAFSKIVTSCGHCAVNGVDMPNTKSIGIELGALRDQFFMSANAFTLPH
ncbi:hypothetical protein ACIOYV_11130 [Pseudomonas sp. NPDC087342]|uniref:hypothetical protein n=1 Tax=Pseudomonas sp. NPDC087342 TaxID=3364437 RepID=UPI00380F6EBC